MRNGYRAPSPAGKGDLAAVDRVLSYIACLRRSSPLFFIPLFPSNLRPFGAPPSIGKREYPRKPLPLEGAAERSEAGLASFFAVDRVLSQTAHLSPFLFHLYHLLETIFPALFHPARTLFGSLRSPPSPRGEGFVRPYCFSTYACIRSDNARKAMLSFRCLPHWGRGTASAVDRVLSFILDLRRIPSLSFIPLEPYPARSARHLPHAGKALCREKRYPRFAAFPIGEGGPRQRWIGCSRISST